MRLHGKLLFAAALAQAVAGCSGKPADLHGLPDDDSQRATLCSKAALAYAGVAEQLAMPAEEQQRRSELLQNVVSATDYFGVTNQSEEQGKKALADIETTLTGGQWLDTLNRCKAAYDLGPAEKVPELPTAPGDKIAACGAASLIASLDGRKVDEVKNPISDAQAAYFMMLLARENSGNMSTAETALVKQVTEVAAGGAAVTLRDQCVAAYPKAKVGSEVTLPADEEAATMGCSLAAELLVQAGGEDAKRGEALKKKLNLMALASSFLRGNLETRTIDAFTALGTAPDVATACEKRYTGA